MTLTIFTPTYNREKELQELYVNLISVQEQSRKNYDVEWIIVDDGSQNDLNSIINSFYSRPGLSIKYIKKENGGKHTAFNVAIEQASGDLFVCIDDDDRLTENAIEEVFRLGELYVGKGYGGFVGRVVDDKGTLLGKTIFADTLISNTIEIRDKYHFWGEPEVFFTDILKKFRFDVFPGERFLTEAYVFDEMSNQYPFIYTNTPLMVKKYLPNGLTDNQLKIRMQCPLGCESYYYKRKQLCKGFKNKLRAEINRQRFARYAIKPPQRRTDCYTILAKPIADLMSKRDRRNCPEFAMTGEAK